MAYIDVEKDSHDFRVILSPHNNIIDPNQVSPRCTLLGVEWQYTILHPYYETLLQDQQAGLFTHPQVLSGLRQIVQEMGIQFALVEFPLKEESFNRIKDDEELVRQKRKKVEIPDQELLFSAWEVASRSIQIDKGSKEFDILERNARQVVIEGSRHELRDIIMAHTALALSRSWDNPNIVAGPIHFGIVQALEMDEAQRVNKILNHPLFKANYDPNQLFVPYVKYISDSSEWYKGFTPIRFKKV